MSFDGSGTFSLLYTWATEAASPPIAISKLDSEFAGIATGLTQCLLRSGGTLTGALTGTTFTGTTFNASASTPSIFLTETDAPTNETKWAFDCNSGDLRLVAWNDGVTSGSVPMTVARTGTTVDSITFVGTTFAVTGNQTISGSLTVGGNTAATVTSGSFTAELASATSGGTTYASATAYWTKTGNVVTLTLPATFEVAALDGANFVFVRGLPAAIRSACTLNQRVVAPVLQAGSYEAGHAEIFNASAAYIRFKPSSNSAVWEISPGSVCGPAQGCTLSYRVAD